MVQMKLNALHVRLIDIIMILLMNVLQNAQQELKLVTKFVIINAQFILKEFALIALIQQVN